MLARLSGGVERTRGRRSCRDWRWRVRLARWILVGTLAVPGLAPAADQRPDRRDEAMEVRILRVLPGVVGILTEVSAEVTLNCGASDSTYVVRPEPRVENGTGFIIHPDGWVATNGHVVQSVYADDDHHVARFLRAAAEKVCGPDLATLPDGVRRERLQAILQDPANRKGVRLFKQLKVFLATRVLPDVEPLMGLPALVKAYSPPIDPQAVRQGAQTPPMLDAAIIKIEATNLPTVPLAATARRTHLGQPLFIIGYPGVVLWHDYLSKRTQSEATVTFGRVSSLKLDINDRQVIQTDAAISWGNSGGPAFSRNDEVLGLATFISTSAGGEQAIQGFNFIIPVDTIHALARQIGLTPNTDSPFTAGWNQAITAYFQGRFGDALKWLDAAEKACPGLRDVERLKRLLADLVRETPR